MGIREILYVMGCLNIIVVIDHKPWKGLFDDRKSEQDPKSLTVSTKGKDPEISIYHPALPWELA